MNTRITKNMLSLQTESALNTNRAATTEKQQQQQNWSEQLGASNNNKNKTNKGSDESVWQTGKGRGRQRE